MRVVAQLAQEDQRAHGPARREKRAARAQFGVVAERGGGSGVDVVRVHTHAVSDAASRRQRHRIRTDAAGGVRDCSAGRDGFGEACVLGLHARVPVDVRPGATVPFNFRSTG